MNCCNDYGTCDRNKDNCPARGPNPLLVARIKKTMPSFAPAPEATEIKARWIAVGAFVCGLLAGLLPLSLAVLLVIAGQKLGQLL
jgi:hypothetical protein